jgi:hypothetical protein
MKSAAFLMAALLVIWILTAQSAQLERSVSPSGQFVIYGGDTTTRGALSTLAERIKADLLTIIRRRDDWKTALVINLQLPAANLPEIPTSDLRISQTDGSLKFQLDLNLSKQIDSLQIEHQLTRAILLEMVYRNETQIAAGDSYVEPPVWLIDGLLAAMPHRDNGQLKEALGVSGRIMSLKKFLQQRPASLDSAGRLLYRAYSFALVQLLIETRDGRGRLGRYIDNLSFATNDPLSDLENAFPELGRNGEIWKAKLISLATRAELLTFSQSEERLSELLNTSLASDGSGKSLSLEDICQQKLNRRDQLALQRFAQELIVFSEHVNPLLRPIVQDYQHLAARLALGKDRSASARLAQLKELRSKLSRRMTDVDDYMNWFEATQLTTPSGAFDNYLNSAGERRNAAHHRTDALSVYLDAVEQQN